MTHRRIVLILTLTLLLSAAGCNLPSGKSDSKNQTAVARTLTSIYKKTKTAATTPPPAATMPPIPTSQPPTAAPTLQPSATTTSQPAASACDAITFIADITVPDGTIFTPGQAFTKTWRLQNSGTCTWTTGYKLVFASGEQMNGPASIPLPSVVNPGQTIDLSVALTAPAAPGLYRGSWMLENTSGVRFALSGTIPFWVEINVEGTAAVTNTPHFAITLVKPMLTLKPPIITLMPFATAISP